MSDWLPSTKPDWWSTVANFADSPTEFIEKRIATYLVGGIIAAIEVATGRIRWVWGVFADAVADAGSSLDYAFAGGGTAILNALGEVPALLTTLSSSLGPITGPIAVSVGALLLAFVLWQVIERAPGALWKVWQAIPGT